MTKQAAITPYPYFTDTSGTALDGGKIYIGTAGLDPRTNPIVVYQDAANTIAWAQPLRTVSGYPTYQGAASNFYPSEGSFSILITDVNGAIVTRDLNVVSVTEFAVQEAESAATAAADAAIIPYVEEVTLLASSANSSATNAANSASAAAIAAAFQRVLATTPSALPYEVKTITLGTAGTGASVSGEFALTVAGGPIGHTAFVTIAGGTQTGVRIGDRGISTSATAPTYTLPTITGLTGATAPTATTGTIGVNDVFSAPTADGLSVGAWGNNAGSLATAPFGLGQSTMPLSAYNALIQSIIFQGSGATPYSLSLTDVDGFVFGGIAPDTVKLKSWLLTTAALFGSTGILSRVDADGFVSDILDSTGALAAPMFIPEPAVTKQRRSADRIIRSAQRPIVTTIAGSDPVTVGTAGANSTINTSCTTAFNTSTGIGGGGAASAQINDARIEAVTGALVNDGVAGWSSKTLIGTDNVRRPNSGAGIRLGFDGQTIDFGVSTVGSTDSNANKMRIRVTDLATGQRYFTASADYALTYNTTKFYKIDFGSRGRRLIEVYIGSAVALTCINYGPNDSIWKAPSASPRTAVFGDSWTYGLHSSGTAYSGVKSALGQAMADALGVENPWISGVPATGWCRANGSYGNWLDRIQRGDLAPALAGNLDLIAFFGSINDSAWSDTDVCASMGQALRTLRQQQQNAVIVVCGPQFVNAAQTPATRYTAMGLAVQSLNDPAILWVNNGPTGSDPWLTGTGTTSAPTGSGNGDIYIGPDGAHPVDDTAEAYFGNRMAASVLRAVSAWRS